MGLTDTRLRELKAQAKPYQEADGGGLFIEILPGGAKPWRLRYRLHGKQEKLTLGEHPDYLLAQARQWRDDCTALVRRGLSPMAIKRGDPIPESASAETRELAQAFIRNWCLKVRERSAPREPEPAAREPALSSELFARPGRTQVAELTAAAVGAIGEVKALFDTMAVMNPTPENAAYVQRLIGIGQEICLKWTRHFEERRPPSSAVPGDDKG